MQQHYPHQHQHQHHQQYLPHSHSQQEQAQAQQQHTSINSSSTARTSNFNASSILSSEICHTHSSCAKRTAASSPSSQPINRHSIPASLSSPNPSFSTPTTLLAASQPSSTIATLSTTITAPSSPAPRQDQDKVKGTIHGITSSSSTAGIHSIITNTLNPGMRMSDSNPPTCSTSTSTNDLQLPTPSQAQPQFSIVHHPVKDTMMIVSLLLSQKVHKNDAHYNPQIDPITLFHSRAVPRISIEAYLTRILQYIPFTNEVLLNVLVYLDRIGGLSEMEMETIEEVEDEEGHEITQECIPQRTSTPFPTTTTPSSCHSSTASTLSCSQSHLSIRSFQSNCCHTCSSASVPTCPSCTPTPNSPKVQSSASASSEAVLSASSAHPSLAPSSSTSSSSPSQSSSSWIDSSNNQASLGAHSVTVSSTDSYSTDNNTSPSLNPDPPVVHKRARYSESHEDSKVDWSNDVEQDQQQQQEHTSKRQKHQQYSTPSQTPWASMQHPAPTPTPTLSQPPPTPKPTTATVDVRCTPGGSTPAMTPRMAVTANGFRINSFNIHRLLITCLMVAAKFTSDLFYSNARYAKVGGLSLLELNQLELEFLFTTRFELNVKVEELQRVGNALLRFRQQLVAPVRHSRNQVNFSQNGPTTATATAVVNEDTASNVINAAQTNNNNGKAQQGKVGRFSIPSPTSPKNGPMSDRVTPSTPSGSTLVHVATATASATGASQPSSETVVIASSSMTQRAQLLSPPEEKQKWAESEVQESEERVDLRQSTTLTGSIESPHAPSSAP